MELTVLIGRLLFSSIFVSSGVNHLTKRKHMAEYAGQMGVPMAGAAVVGSGLMILAGGVMIALGLWADLGAALILAFVVPTSVLMHGFWKFDDDQMKQQQQIHFSKNVAMAGGALMIMGWYACVGGHAALSVTGPMFL
jgi:putative oxidoreductase